MYDPDEVIGKRYERGLLPFGGSVNSSGIITYALSEREFINCMEKLRTLE
jgi:hypothetical protein